MENNKIDRVISSLRSPDHSLERVPNTVRQAIADAMEHLRTENEILKLELFKSKMAYDAVLERCHMSNKAEA